jgi:hypothetical protein
LVFGDATESIISLVMFIDSWYVVMQMNWPFLVTGESQKLSLVMLMNLTVFFW